jgi:hypothetical protein
LFHKFNPLDTIGDHIHQISWLGVSEMVGYSNETRDAAIITVITLTAHYFGSSLASSSTE